jgi:transposase InsO family protein
MMCDLLSVSRSGLHLALVLDLFARKIVGWATSPTMPQELTLEALQVALGWRDPDADLLHHSDRGSQYAAKDYRDVLKARGIKESMSRKGNCRDNAPMESAKRRYVVTTDSKHNLPVAPNLPDRNFQPEQPNAVWTGDITYIPTDEGWLYLAAVIVSMNLANLLHV